MNINQGKTEILGENSAPFTNCPSQILRGQLSDWIQSSMVGSLSYGASCFLFFPGMFYILIVGTVLLTSQSTVILELSVIETYVGILGITDCPYKGDV